MAEVTKANGGVATSVNTTGSLTHIRVNFNSVDVSAKFGVNGAVEKAAEVIQGAGFNIVMIGTAQDSDATADGVRMALEGTFGTDTYDGTNSETVAAHLEDVLQAVAATVDGVAFGSVTVDAFTY